MVVVAEYVFHLMVSDSRPVIHYYNSKLRVTSEVPSVHCLKSKDNID